MTRTIVVRFASAFDPKPVNVNDEIGLDPHQSYTLAQHLEDLAGQGVATFPSNVPGVYTGWNGATSCYLREVEQEIDESLVDAETLALLREPLAATA